MDVVAYDADDLETWLERAPAVHAWISAHLGKDPHEAESLETWWESWSGETRPALPPSLLLSGRDAIAEQIRQSVSGEAAVLALSGDSQEEVVAFIAATLLGGEAADVRGELGRTLIVRTSRAWRRLAVADRPLILIPYYDKPDVALATRHGHHVLVPLGREVAASRGTDVPRLRRYGIEAALIEAGLSRERASTLATLGRRSLLSLRRELAISPEVQAPVWSRPEHALEVLPAVLAGTWRDDIEGDRAAISELAGRSYSVVSQILTRWANASDPPVRRIGNVWIVAAKQDAWTLTARSLTPDNLQRFRQVALDVIGSDDPSLDLAPRERMMSSILGKERAHSGHLIRGLADTLALIAATSEQVPLANGRRGRDEADFVVHKLLNAANEDPSGRHWMALSHVLPLLGEAAPGMFLEAVDAGLRGDDPVVPKLIQDVEGFDSAFGSSAHTGLLWALENLAWSPEYLGRAVLLLAKLTRLDPGGRLLNRPGNSLREILVLWHPSTAASLEQRLQVIDLLRKREPEVAWQLLLRLIPSGHDVSHPTHSPTWRDWKPEQEEGVSYAELGLAVEGVATRALEDAGLDGRRWAGLVSCVADLTPSLRAEVIDKVQTLQPSDLTNDGRAALEKTLRDLVARHREFPDTKWAMPQTDVDRLAEAIPRFESDEPAVKHAWLFLRGAVRSFGDAERDERYEALAKAQAEAVREIYEANGLVSVLEWSEQFDPAFGAFDVGRALAMTELGKTVEDELFVALTSEVAAHRQVVRGYAHHMRWREGEEWVEATLKAQASAWSPAQQAEFLSALPTTLRIWDLAEELGEETDYEYWQRAHHWGLPDRGKACIRAAHKLMEHGRPYAVIELLDHYADDIPSGPPADLIADALEKAAHTTPPSNLGSMFSYHVGRHLDRLEEAGFDEQRLAALEWLYLPLFRFEKRRSGVLHRELATVPSFFVEIVSLIYRAKGEEPRDLSEEEQALARTAHDLLDSWRLVPGTQDDDTVDGNALREWVSEARRLLAECGRSEIGDHRIGHVLRYGPKPQDDEWPAEPIRDLIEEVASEDLEEGLRIEVYNSRGVTSRSPTEGGQQERDLADKYRRFATSASTKWPRTAAMLIRIAESYERDARRHDLDAELTEDLWR